MKLFFLAFLLIVKIYFTNSTQFGNESIKDAPIFVNAESYGNNKFKAKYGSKIQCKYEYGPVVTNEKNEIIKMVVDNEKKNHSLRLINLGNRTILKETQIDTRKIRILANQTLIAFFSNAALDIDTFALDSGSHYSCCLGSKLNNYACSILDFEYPNDHFFFSFFAVKGITFLLLIMILFLATMVINRSKSLKKSNQIAAMSQRPENLFTLTMPQMSTKLQTNDLYEQYNLVNERQRIRALKIDCNDFPPSYDELAKEDQNLKKF